MSKSLQKEICALVIKAQIYNEIAHKGNFEFYSKKADCVRKAVSLIRKNSYCGWRFYKDITPDQNGYASTITYFELKYGKEIYQISFHNPINRDEYEVRNFGSPIKWDGEIGGSAKGARILNKIFKLGFKFTRFS